MKKQLRMLMMLVSITGIVFTSCSKKDDVGIDQKGNTGTRLKSASVTALPAYNDNRVAYYVFDVTPAGQGILPLTTFTDNANIVVLFEGTLWELADTVNYNSGWMQNAYYKNKKQILTDIQTLRARGIKVLMNVDDAASWSTATPF
ncbi:MAG TPA: hypothetical protein VHO90_10360, partial [Bacteroidales bacterium]|nr:hypothetical protein [Bacteroidales bacterium]